MQTAATRLRLVKIQQMSPNLGDEIKVAEKTRIRRCRHCKTELVIVGFERKLITRGKDKGMSIVRDLLGCPNQECRKNV